MTTLARRRASRHLTDAQRALYATQGYLLVEGCVPDAFLARAGRLVEAEVEAHLAEWRAAGVAVDDGPEDDLGSRYHRAWVAAGRPRQPTLVDPEARRRLRAAAGEPWLAGLAASALGARRAAVLETCFVRTKLPGDEATTLPWHQDAQCLRPISGTEFVTAWIPLGDVSQETSCLEVAPVGPGQPMFETARSEVTDYVCMRADDAAHLEPTRVIRMHRGDLLLMGPFLPHRTVDGTRPKARCSVDVRFSPAEGSGGRHRRATAPRADQIT